MVCFSARRWPSRLTLPVVLPLAGGSWRLSFVYWGIPAILTAALIVFFAPRDTTRTAVTVPLRWWPNWRDKQLWRLALCLGCINTCYFATNTFLPDYLTATGHGDLISAALTSLNFCQLPASFIMLGMAPRLVRMPASYVTVGVLSLISVIGMALMPGWPVVAWAGLLGFAGAAGLILVLALPPLLSAPEDVHRLASAMFTISYPCAVLMSILSGYLWDKTDISWIRLCADRHRRGGARRVAARHRSRSPPSLAEREAHRHDDIERVRSNIGRDLWQGLGAMHERQHFRVEIGMARAAFEPRIRDLARTTERETQEHDALLATALRQHRIALIALELRRDQIAEARRGGVDAWTRWCADRGLRRRCSWRSGCSRRLRLGPRRLDMP